METIEHSPTGGVIELPKATGGDEKKRRGGWGGGGQEVLKQTLLTIPSLTLNGHLWLEVLPLTDFSSTCLISNSCPPPPKQQPLESKKVVSFFLLSPLPVALRQEITFVK